MAIFTIKLKLCKNNLSKHHFPDFLGKIPFFYSVYKMYFNSVALILSEHLRFLPGKKTYRNLMIAMRIVIEK